MKAGGRRATALAIAGVVAGLLVAPNADARPRRGGSSEADCQWAMYGRDPGRSFDFDGAGDCGPVLDAANASTLVPTWFFKTPATVTASPAVKDGRVFVGDWTGTMYALDADDGSLLWSQTTEPAPGAPFGPIVSSAAVAPDRNGRDLVVVGSGPRLYAFDAQTGAIAWIGYFGSGAADPALGLPDDHPVDEETEIESSPVVHDGVVYVGMDVHNRRADGPGGYGVVGGVLAVDLDDGSLIDHFDPEWDFDDADGNRLSGCSSVWSSPTLDVENDLLFFATGNCPHGYAAEDWGRHVEAVSAIDLARFRRGHTHESKLVRWTFTPEPGNQKDHDFGATPNLFVDEAGRQVIGVGRKDGAYYAFDPGSGALRWSTKVADTLQPRRNFDVGGFIGSTATGGGDVFGATALGGPAYFHALDGATGALEWQSAAGPSYAASAHSGGAVVAGALDSTLKVFDAETGAVLFSAPLAGPVSSGPAIVGDRVYIGSGTASSDLCAKDQPGSEQCFAAFDETLGAAGGVHGFRVAVDVGALVPGGGRR